MKKTPDTMITMVLLFVIGLAVTGITTLSAGTEKKEPELVQSLDRY